MDLGLESDCESVSSMLTFCAARHADPASESRAWETTKGTVESAVKTEEEDPRDFDSGSDSDSDFEKSDDENAIMASRATAFIATYTTKLWSHRQPGRALRARLVPITHGRRYRLLAKGISVPINLKDWRYNHKVFREKLQTLAKAMGCSFAEAWNIAINNKAPGLSVKVYSCKDDGIGGIGSMKFKLFRARKVARQDLPSPRPDGVSAVADPPIQAKVSMIEAPSREIKREAGLNESARPCEDKIGSETTPVHGVKRKAGFSTGAGPKILKVEAPSREIKREAGLNEPARQCEDKIDSETTPVHAAKRKAESSADVKSECSPEQTPEARAAKRMTNGAFAPKEVVQGQGKKGLIGAKALELDSTAELCIALTQARRERDEFFRQLNAVTRDRDRLFDLYNKLTAASAAAASAAQ